MESAQPGWGLVTRHTGTPTADIRHTDMVITRVATTTITGAIPIRERITTVGGLTTAIDITSTTNVITTTTKKHRFKSWLIGWVEATPSQLFCVGCELSR